MQIRLSNIHRRVCELLDEHGVAVLSMEDLYFGRNASSAFAVGQARGVVMLAAGQRRLPCFSYTPQQVKHSVCGSGRAAKDQVGRMVQMLLSLEAVPRPDHAADALAIAICHASGAPHAAAVAESSAVSGGAGAGALDELEQIDDASSLQDIQVYRGHA